MTSIKDLFEKDQAGFTVYSPDCMQSRLWGNLDHAIHEATGFQVVHRQWIYHDYNSIMRFYTPAGEELPAEQDPQEAAQKYNNIPAENLQYGHLVVQLFISAPSLMTIWQGDKAIETLFALKGRTHPADAGAETVRGRFCCDNAVCNLLHVSDNYTEAQRELKAVNLSHVLDEEVSNLPLIDAIPLPDSYIAHSGIVILCDVLRRLLITRRTGDKITFQLPSSGDAKETQLLLKGILQDFAEKEAGSSLAQFIHAYLAGDVITVSAMLKKMPVTKWEYFVIQCGAITREKWNTYLPKA